MNFFDSRVSPEAVAEVNNVLRSGFLSEGATVVAFEQALAQQLGLAHPVALNSGTSALHLALALAGVGPGDEVILPAQTFIATGLVVLMQGAIPVFGDVQRDTGNLDPDSVRARLTPRTRAVIPVHWGGYPCDLDEINAVAQAAGIVVIEDAAHALGAEYRGKPIGAVSRFTAFSFQAIKHLTTGDGGALACRDAADEHGARVRRWFAIDREGSSPSILGERIYDATVLGYKYHMNNLAAALGLGNLVQIQAVLARYRAIAARYAEGLAGVPGLRRLRRADDRRSAHWFFPLLVERREDFIRMLAARDCVASVVHRRIDRNTVFGGMRDDLPGQAYFDEHQCALPIHAALTDDEVERIIAAARGGW